MSSAEIITELSEVQLCVRAELATAIVNIHMVTNTDSLQCSGASIGTHRHICAFFNGPDEEQRFNSEFCCPVEPKSSSNPLLPAMLFFGSAHADPPTKPTGSAESTTARDGRRLAVQLYNPSTHQCAIYGSSIKTGVFDPPLIGNSRMSAASFAVRIVGRVAQSSYGSSGKESMQTEPGSSRRTPMMVGGHGKRTGFTRANDSLTEPVLLAVDSVMQHHSAVPLPS